MTDSHKNSFPRDLKECFNQIDLDLSCHSNLSNEKLIMIMNKNSGLAPYHHEFSTSHMDPQIISGFISAMASFMGAVMGESPMQWTTEYGTESLFLVEQGTWILGVLLVSRETTDSRTKLKTVVHDFEDCFSVLKDSDGFEGSAIQDFDNYVRRLFVNDLITDRTIVVKRPEWRESLMDFHFPSDAFSVSKILLSFNEVKTVKQIAEFLNLSRGEVTELVSQAYWYKAVFLKYVPSDDEIFLLSGKSSTFIFQKDNPLRLSSVSLHVIASLDGRTNLFQLSKGIDISESEVLLDELGILVTRGFIQRISLEQQRVLRNESILSFLILEGSRNIGSKKMKQIFETIRYDWGGKFPRIYRVTLTNDMHARCKIDELMSTDDLDNLAKVLDLLIEELYRHLSMMCGKRTKERILFKLKSSGWLEASTSGSIKD